MIKVLDHGYVRLVSYTQPPVSAPISVRDFNDREIAQEVRRDARWTGDLEIVRAARTSFDADWRTGEDAGKDIKLIERLWKDGHTSPFEAMSFSFEIQAPIFVFRQWHRHRTQSYSEVSARYAELPEMFYLPELENIGVQSKLNKQGRKPEEENIFAKVFRDRLEEHSKTAFQEYRIALSNDIPRELARLFLPFNTYSRMYATANLLNWFRFLTLRLHPHAQYEIRVYAEAILHMIEDICPVAVQAYTNP